MRFYVAPNSRFDKNPGGSISATNNHLVLLAENNEGYRNLVKLVTAGYLEGFYYKPRIDKEILAKHSKGLIGLTACLKGEVPAAALRGDEDRAIQAARTYRDILGEGNFFLEIQDHGLKNDNEKIVNSKLFELAKKEGLPVVATNDCHYPRKDDYEAHDILLCIGTGKKSDDAERLKYPGDQFYFKSSEEMAEIFQGYEEAYNNTLAIAERIHVDLEREAFHLPEFAVPDGSTIDEYFEKVVWEGFKQRSRRIRGANRLRGISTFHLRLRNPSPTRDSTSSKTWVSRLLSHRVGFHPFRQGKRNSRWAGTRLRRGKPGRFQPSHHKCRSPRARAHLRTFLESRTSQHAGHRYRLL